MIAGIDLKALGSLIRGFVAVKISVTKSYNFIITVQDDDFQILPYFYNLPDFYNLCVKEHRFVG